MLVIPKLASRTALIQCMPPSHSTQAKLFFSSCTDTMICVSSPPGHNFPLKLREGSHPRSWLSFNIKFTLFTCPLLVFSLRSQNSNPCLFPKSTFDGVCGINKLRTSRHAYVINEPKQKRASAELNGFMD